MSDVLTKDKKEKLVDYLKSNKGLGQSALIPALHKAQELFGYLPREAVEEISSHLNIPTSHIWGVETFYHYFSLKPRGKHIISVCLGTACYVRGAGRILDKIKDVLGIEPGETTPDRLFTLEATSCLSCCGLAPVMMINEKVYGELTTKKVSTILKGLK
ncbi:MAG: NADP-reducing hydrogenase subunit HndA [Syntrophomonadaceae bacterium]|nr:NADP-reducing hydrogenase subunit HndA [Bacillota bacterium]